MLTNKFYFVKVFSLLNNLWQSIKYALFVHIDVHAWEKREGKREKGGGRGWWVSYTHLEGLCYKYYVMKVMTRMISN